MSRRRCSRSRLAIAVVLCAGFARASGAQSTAEFKSRVDSLARIWRPLTTVQVRADNVQAALLPRDSIRVGSLIVRPDTPYVEVSRAAAEQLSPMIDRAYGRFASRLTRYQFVVRARSATQAGTSVVSGVADATGVIRLRGGVEAKQSTIADSWSHKAEEIITDELGPDVRLWMQSVMPIGRSDASTWSQARIALLLAGSEGARKCAETGGRPCGEVLGVIPVDDPAFVFYDERQRLALIKQLSFIIRRVDPRQYDRCVQTGMGPVCDSLAHMIPSDAVPPPVHPLVRQSLVRFALDVGGAGAFDRFAGGKTMNERIELAARMPMDSVVARWRTTIMDARTTSTALNVTTAVSSLFWACLCAGLALRSSRWR